MIDITLPEFKELTDQAYAHKSYQLVDDEPTLVGKYCRVTPIEDGLFDVWVCNTVALADGIGTRRLNNIAAAAAALPTTEHLRTPIVPATRWDGEDLYRLCKVSLLGLSKQLGLRKRAKHSGNIQNLRKEA